MKKQPCVYIMANQRNGTLYVGVTADLVARVYWHKQGINPGFTQTYNCKRLVYFEQFGTLMEAFRREKQLKRWRRGWKLQLIHDFNPRWEDLYPRLLS